MLLDEKPKYCYADIKIMPTFVSYVSSRSECNPYKDNMLPIFTAPMTAIIDENNYQKYIDNKITPILPRSVHYDIRYEMMLKGMWVALSLSEFKNIFIDNPIDIDIAYNKIHVLLDIANGHMDCAISICHNVKKTYGENVIIMAGNIANPETYLKYCEAGIDYVRCGIGSGSVCITSSQTAIHYPMASLISEITDMKDELIHTYGYDNVTKIIADGGIKNYDDVIKALALGADYVMIGGLFAEMEEACGEIFRNDDGTLTRTIFGMASSYGQIAINGSKTKTSEGIMKSHKIKYTLQKWTQNMADYMRSAMSYCGCKDIKDFYNYAKCIVVSPNTYNSINK